MPIVIEEMMIETAPAEPRAQGGPDEAKRPPSLADRLLEHRAATERRARLMVD